jgi:excisionase family DNA binding protein
MAETLLTLEQVAEYLNVDRCAVYQLVAVRALTGFKVGYQWQFEKAMIETWLMRNSNIQSEQFH